jgi:head-tail adaptor
LLARAERESNKLKVKTWTKLGKASIRLAAVVEVLMEVTAAERDGVAFEPVSLTQVWAQIEAVVPREQISQALIDIVALAGQADEDADAAWRAELVKRYATVRPFLPLPDLWGGGRNRAGVREIDQDLLIGCGGSRSSAGRSCSGSSRRPPPRTAQAATSSGTRPA